MAQITLPYTLANGNTADGGQVQQNFDAIVTQVNGHLDNTNLANGAVTLAKLASDVKVIEAIYSDFVPYFLDGVISGTTISVPASTETTIFSQTITLSAARYLLFQANYYITSSASGGQFSYIVKDGTSELLHNSIDTNGYGMNLTFQFIKQLTAGTHTIYFNVYPDGTNRVVTDRAFTIIQFAF